MFHESCVMCHKKRRFRDIWAFFPPLPEKGEGWGEGGLVREMCQSDRLHSYLPLTLSLSSLGRGKFRSRKSSVGLNHNWISRSASWESEDA